MTYHRCIGIGGGMAKKSPKRGEPIPPPAKRTEARREDRPVTFSATRAGREQKYVVANQETIAAIQALLAATDRAEFPQKLSRALTLCLAHKEKEGFEFVWRANADFGRTKGASEAELHAAYSRLATKFGED
jgi:hypothetical protein